MIIMMGSPKGGVGKTTLIANLASLLLSRGKSVTVLRADKNDELADFFSRREEAGLPMCPLHSAWGDISREMKRLQKMSDIVLVDTAGHDSMEFRSALTAADVLLSPVRPSSQGEVDNMNKVNEMVRYVQANENPSLKGYFLFNRCKPKATDAIELTRSLSEDPNWIPALRTWINQLDVFESAFNLGAGVHDVSSASSLTKARALIELLADEIGL
ncbi:MULTISPECIES: ParA family protein [Pantoea]|uniref:ParA family protein n=1 Tax=Pantoea TaxID=53335 RepID=UPI000B509611|nr:MULTISPECIES: ParA family protein [Pantoea]KAA6093629.1 ParA family protein [Pantoea sp. B_9]KAA6105712.1 ParA family protein [Pantoea sp. B_10]KAA8669095.1 ParA family protein [Pantoea dispersa]OWS75219.1 plasmid partition protein A [Pantoea sp. VS1]